MFRSRARDVVYPQAEHQRLAGVVAARWAEPPLEPFDSFVHGVATHDRGYGELDADPIGGIAMERWLVIQRAGIEARADAIADLVVAMHSFRLVANVPMPIPDDVKREFEAIRDARIVSAGVDAARAAAADAVTDVCDRLSFAFCFEHAEAGTIGGISYAVEADGSATLSPWPLRVDALEETVTGYEAEGYPDRLVPVERRFLLRPA